MIVLPSVCPTQFLANWCSFHFVFDPHNDCPIQCLSNCAFVLIHVCPTQYWFISVFVKLHFCPTQCFSNKIFVWHEFFPNQCLSKLNIKVCLTSCLTLWVFAPLDVCLTLAQCLKHFVLVPISVCLTRCLSHLIFVQFNDTIVSIQCLLECSKIQNFFKINFRRYRKGV